MGLFSKRKTESRPGAGGSDERDRSVELVLPVGSMVTAADFNVWLCEWSGASAGATAILPVGLIWEGPRASDPALGEPSGAWVWSMSWRSWTPSAPPKSATHSDWRVNDWVAVLEVIGDVFDRSGGATRLISGPPAYAIGAVVGLARRTGGQVRIPRQAQQPPPDPEATWSVYVDRVLSAEEVLTALAASVPGLAEAAESPIGDSWILTAPNDLALRLDVLDLEADEDWEQFGGPGDLDVCAVRRFGVQRLCAIRVEGPDDWADARTRGDLDRLAYSCAAALGGLAVDADGFPVVES